MPQLKIVTCPNAILREQAEPVDYKEIKKPEYQQLIDDMTETMLQSDGIGLAAPQIGKSIRMVIVLDGDRPLTLINPKIVRASWAKHWVEEGCLSVPGIFGLVKRHRRIKVKALDRNSKKLCFKAKDLLATIIQHETDHLKGVLFIDKAKKIHEITVNNK